MCSKQSPSISPGSAADERKRKRLQCGRESAQRWRIKQQQHLEGLNGEEQRLLDENRKVREMIDGVTQRYLDLVSENNVLRAQLAELTDRLSSLNSMLQIPSEVSGLAFDISADTFLDLWELTCPADQPITASAPDEMFQY